MSAQRRGRLLRQPHGFEGLGSSRVAVLVHSEGLGRNSAHCTRGMRHTPRCDDNDRLVHADRLTAVGASDLWTDLSCPHRGHAAQLIGATKPSGYGRDSVVGHSWAIPRPARPRAGGGGGPGRGGWSFATSGMGYEEERAADADSTPRGVALHQAGGAHRATTGPFHLPMSAGGRNIPSSFWGPSPPCSGPQDPLRALHPGSARSASSRRVYCQTLPCLNRAETERSALCEQKDVVRARGTPHAPRARLDTYFASPASLGGALALAVLLRHRHSLRPRSARALSASA